MRANDQFFIFSVEYYKNTSEENKIAIKLAKFLLNKYKIPFKNVDGSYKGVTEAAFLVPAKHEDFIMELAQSAHQESVLFVDSLRNASLIYIDGGVVEKLPGRFQEVDRDEALKIDAFTRDAFSNKYYAVV